jgi:hypothetical protein
MELARRRIMRLTWDLKKDIEAAKKGRLPWWVLLAWGTVCLPVVSPLNHVGRLELALPILGSFAIFSFLLMLKWNLRSRIWFWMMLLILPWTAKWVSPLVTGGIASVDLCLLLAIVSAAGRLIDGPGKRTRRSVGE